MKSINFDEGYKSLMINGDPERVISFNPTDLGMMIRIVDGMEAINKAKVHMSELKANEENTVSGRFKQDSEVLKSFSDMVKEQINYILNNNVADTIFGKQSPVAFVGGCMLYERVLDVLIPYVTEELAIAKEESDKRIAKYMDQINEIEGDFDDRESAEND